MTTPGRTPPSPGCVAVCLTYALLLAFLLWGLSTPDLDRVWQLGLELGTGQVTTLSGADRRVLERALAKHPDLASSLLSGRDIGLLSEHSDGWIAGPAAVVLRDRGPGGGRPIAFEVETPEEFMPFSLRLRGRGWEQTLAVERQGLLTVDLPGEAEEPEIIVVTLREAAGGRRFSADPSVPGLRISFPAARPPR